MNDKSARRDVGIDPPERLLMGPGPSNPDPAVLQAMSRNMVGHLDPYFLDVLDRTMEMLRAVFRTKNHHTIPMSGTGTSGLETIVLNLIEPGDDVIVANTTTQDVVAGAAVEVVVAFAADQEVVAITAIQVVMAKPAAQ